MVKPLSLNLPLSADDAGRLKIGDFVLLSGRIVTGRDRVHKYLLDESPQKEEPPFDLTGTVLYHCGPVTRKIDGGYRVISAGPTTSMRVEMYEAALIKKYNLRGIMGKGGMGEKTARGLEENSCVYLNTFGGAAAYLADRIKRIIDVWKLDEFGPTEAMWLFEVEDFPAIVTMDAHGNDLHRDIENASFKKFSELIGR